MSSVSPVAEPESTNEDAVFASLLRGVRRAQGFTLFFAICNEPLRRDALIVRLSASLPDGLETTTLTASSVDPLRDVLEIMRKGRPRPVMVLGLERGHSYADRNAPVLESLNRRREEWRDHVPRAVVFWIPEYLLRPLVRVAPDFFDWRAGTFRFSDTDPRGSKSIATDGVSSHWTETWRLHPDERSARMQRLREWIRSPVEDDSTKTTWLLELVTHQIATGEWEDALRTCREELLPLCDRLGDLRRKAATLEHIAHILTARGMFDEALRIRREQELPIYEGLKDVRSQAATKGQVAHILAMRGDLDEALRIRREEELPIYEGLKDLRSKAATMGQIAHVLALRGELDEALRIRRDEELPVYELLGDERSKTVARGQIADILAKRGEVDEAMRIRLEEELPLYEALGDVRSKVITMGKIADVLTARGEFDEALRIRRNEQVPVYERLGNVRSKALTMGKIADLLFKRGELDEALRIRQEEELPVLESMGDAKSMTTSLMNIAVILLERGRSEDRQPALKLLNEALALAERLRLPEARKIRDLLKKET